MNTKNMDELYASVIIKKGLKLEKGEEVFIVSSVETCDFTRTVVNKAYEQGAKKVTVLYADEQVTLARLKNEDKDVLTNIEKWEILQRDYIPEKKCAYLNILSESPDIYKDVDGRLLADFSIAKHKAFEKFYDSSMGNIFKWCLVGYPSKAWADKVFPSDKDALEKLKKLIYSTMRLDTPDPEKAWDEHCEKLRKTYEYLNSMQFDEFYYENSLGTSLSVGMPKNYVFAGGGDSTLDGKGFIANMPTEEVFSAPHKYKVNGKIVSSMPLVHNGKVVKDFYFVLKDGKIVDFDAKEGKDVLEGIISTDEGSHYLGEIALVSYNTPIRKMNTLFYNTLFDENASCHFAIGRAYASCVKGGEEMSKEEKENAGINDSLEHVDFMIGTSDLSIVGIKDGKRYPIFKNGELVDF